MTREVRETLSAVGIFDNVISFPKHELVEVRESCWPEDPESILSDKLETTQGRSEHWKIVSCGCAVKTAVCKKLEITKQMYYRCWQKYGGMQPEMAKEFETLQKENDRWKKMVSGRDIDMNILKEFTKRNGSVPKNSPVDYMFLLAK